MVSRIPYVHSLGPHEGLSQVEPVPAPAPATTAGDPLWARMVSAFATPFTGAISQRIAGPAGYPSGYYVQTPVGQFTGASSGGFDPRTLLLLGGALLLAMVVMKK